MRVSLFVYVCCCAYVCDISSFLRIYSSISFRCLYFSFPNRICEVRAHLYAGLPLLLFDNHAHAQSVAIGSPAAYAVKLYIDCLIGLVAYLAGSCVRLFPS